AAVAGVVAWLALAGGGSRPGSLIQNPVLGKFVHVGDSEMGESWTPWRTRGSVTFRRPGFEPGKELFSGGGAFTAGIYQQVTGAVPGATYLGYIGSASKYGAVDSGKKDKDIIFRTVGIDPLGGTDPNSPNIKWGSV